MIYSRKPGNCEMCNCDRISVYLSAVVSVQDYFLKAGILGFHDPVVGLAWLSIFFAFPSSGARLARLCTGVRDWGANSLGIYSRFSD